jgi:predicted nicotinamide N-methyase
MLHSRLRALPRRRADQPLPSDPCISTTDPGADAEDVDDESAEDLFSSSLSTMFPDDAPQFHGDPGQHLLYSSPRYGDITIMVPSYPGQSEDRNQEDAAETEANEVDEVRKLFAHILWSAGMVVADGLERAHDSDAGMWKVKGETVLELGAGSFPLSSHLYRQKVANQVNLTGAALPSIIAALAGASSITITDHPFSPALGPSGAISFNVAHNLSSSPETSTSTVEIVPHEWGKLSSDPWAVSRKAAYTRIIAADCYWMPSQHENLARTMKWFLAPGGIVWVVAGFHTGRESVAGFFATAVEMGLEIEEIFERDLISSAEGEEVRREWVEVREGEGPGNRTRWCVIALLRHAS